uniref:Uncharacterized protein n=1 Tax=Oryza punctata TaxID=4537 RepID=A0A0E0LAP7_ORYPU
MALELASRGLNLVLVDLDAANLREIAGTIRSRHGGVETKTMVFDLSLLTTDQGDEPLRRLREAMEGLDVGVRVGEQHLRCVGRPGAVFLHEVEVEAWARMMRVNLYVAQFSRGLHVEYASKGIHVQCQAPFFVATRMVENLVEERRLSPFTVTPDAYARAAVRWIGRGGALCTPSVRHQLLWCVAAALPEFVLDWILLHSHLEQRALLRRIGASKAPSPPSSTHEVNSTAN